MATATMLPGQVGFAHDLEVSVPCLKGRETLDVRRVLRRARKVEKAVIEATGIESWASGMGGGYRDISFRFPSEDLVQKGTLAASEALKTLGFEVEVFNIAPSSPSGDGAEDEDEANPERALLVVEMNIPVGSDGDRIERN